MLHVGVFHKKFLAATLICMVFFSLFGLIQFLLEYGQLRQSGIAPRSSFLQFIKRTHLVQLVTDLFCRLAHEFRYWPESHAHIVDRFVICLTVLFHACKITQHVKNLFVDFAGNLILF